MKELIDAETDAYVADTPGFSMLDFIEFDFYTLEDLPHCFPEFEPYMPDCRYTDCSHTKESAKDCAVVAAIERGEIAKERHESYLSIYADLAQKKPWDKK
jgi:ribosome biogenesis GTPase